MKMFENNAFFWQKLDTLFLSSQLKIHKKKNETHDRYSNLVYPVDYGFLLDTVGGENGQISVYRGSSPIDKINTVVVAVDILKKDLDVKLLLACIEEEELEVLRFLNQTDFQKTIVLRRGSDLPSWAVPE